MHGDDLAGIHVQKILQKLVADVGCRDAQKAGGAKNAAHLEGAAVFEGKGGGRNGILHRKAAFHEVLPVKVELGCAVHVEHIVHEFQPLDTVQRLCLHTQPVEVVQQIVLDVLQPGFDLFHAVALDCRRSEILSWSNRCCPWKAAAATSGCTRRAHRQNHPAGTGCGWTSQSLRNRWRYSQRTAQSG